MSKQQTEERINRRNEAGSNPTPRTTYGKSRGVFVPGDVSVWVLPFYITVAKTINPKATVERPKGMCAGDSHCEYIFKIEE